MNPVRPAATVTALVPAADAPAFRAAAIFDGDGVLRASTLERAWRKALAGLAGPAHHDAVDQACVTRKPRLPGARAALQAFEMPGADRRAAALPRAQDATRVVAGLDEVATDALAHGPMARRLA